MSDDLHKRISTFHHNFICSITFGEDILVGKLVKFVRQQASVLVGLTVKSVPPTLFKATCIQDITIKDHDGVVWRNIAEMRIQRCDIDFFESSSLVLVDLVST